MATGFDSTIGYLKRAVIKMLGEQTALQATQPSAIPSALWEGFKVFRYLLDLSPENLRSIRYHSIPFCGPLPGADSLIHVRREQEYTEREVRSLQYLEATEGVPEEFWISEPDAARFNGLLGKRYRGRVINGSMIRYQFCVSNLYHVGALQSVLGASERQIVVEVGGGYGGLAHSLGLILKEKCTYCIIDFPEILLISGIFLALTNPNKSIYIYDSESFTPEFVREGIKRFDFVLIPHFALSKLEAIEDIALLINMTSFQEMTTRQVNEYLEFGNSHCSGYLYSDNADRHSENTELESLSDLLSNYFQLFPSPMFYDKVCRSNYANNAGCRRIYLGIPKGCGRTIPTTTIVGQPQRGNHDLARQVIRAVIPQRIRRLITRAVR